MKRLNLAAGVIVLSLVLFACNQTPKDTAETAPAAEQTIENLKAAITGESNASAKYTAFSKEAEAVGMLNIAKLFAATAEAELVHVQNHQAVLKTLGVEDFVPVIEEHIADKDMLKNLEAAIAGETYEFTEMYPAFIEAAIAENVPNAVKSFMYAMKAEKRHAEHYQAVLEIFKTAGNDKTVSKSWTVCLICGELLPDLVVVYDSETGETMQNCGICGEKWENFKQFNNN
jgi:rubrerythrin